MIRSQESQSTPFTFSTPDLRRPADIVAHDESFLTSSESLFIPNAVKGVGIDMDDLIIEHDPKDLSLKFTEAVLWMRKPELFAEGTLHIGTYINSLQDEDTEQAYREKLYSIAGEVFHMTPDDFADVAERWTHGTVNREERRIAQEDLGFENDEIFWAKYREFGTFVPREPEEYLTLTRGAKDFLVFLNALREAEGLQIHLISNNKRSRLERYVQFMYSQGIPPFNSVNSTRDDHNAPKPSPQALINVAQGNNLVPKSLVYIGNGNEDAEAANAAGWTPLIINRQDRTISSPVNHLRFNDLSQLHATWVDQRARFYAQDARIPREYSARNEIMTREGAEIMLPLEKLREITDFGFDIEETIFNIPHWYLMANFAHFLNWSLSRAKGEQIDARSYLSAMPTIEELSRLSSKDSWEPYKAAWDSFWNKTYSQLNEYSGESKLAKQAIEDFTFNIQNNATRLRAACELLGISENELWAQYKAFWLEIEPSEEMQSMMTPYEVVPGAVELLQALDAAGKRVHFVTNAEDRRMSQLLQQLRKYGFTGDYTLTSLHGTPYKKPSPVGIQGIYRHVGLVQQSELEGKYPFAFFGNAASDLEAGLYAQAAFLFGVNQFAVASDIALPSHYQIRDFSALLGYLQDSKILE